METLSGNELEGTEKTLGGPQVCTEDTEKTLRYLEVFTEDTEDTEEAQCRPQGLSGLSQYPQCKLQGL